MSAVQMIVPSDTTRTYEYFVLPNRLEVVTISEPTTSASAASLMVEVGSFSDPPDLPGLAHFIEHMLFLGTEKYPTEDSYQTFLSDHGGSCNAFTELENTTFHFNISSEHLHEALERFSTFFLCPLFTSSAADREIQAIDNEHDNNLQDDDSRVFQFLRDVSNPGFPFSKFATGNLTTLKTIPSQKGIDVVQRMIEHYNQNYSANRMKLAVLGKESHAELCNWVEEHFSAIPNKDIPLPQYIGQAYTAKELGFWYSMAPVLDFRTLTLLFPMSIGNEEYRCGAFSYLSHLIHHESEGSILCELKRRHWADGLWAGDRVRVSTWTLFSITVDLTVEGMDHVDEIISTCFEYIEMIRQTGFQEYVYEERKKIQEMQFRFLEIASLESLVIDISLGMNRYLPEHSLAGDYLYFERDPRMEAQCLEALKPTNMLVLHQAKELEPLCDTEGTEYYKMRYGVRRLTEAQLQAYLPAPGKPLRTDFHLPEPNPFVATDFALKPLPDGTPEHPQVVYESPRGLLKLWFKQNIHHSKPKAVLKWFFLSRVAYATPRHWLLNCLYVMIAKEQMNNLTYYADTARLDFHLTSSAEGVRVTVKGFSDKLGVLAKHVLKRMLTIVPDEGLFNRMKEQVRQSLVNISKDQAYDLALEQSSTIFTVTRWRDQDMLPLIDGLSMDELAPYIRSLYSQGFVQCFVHGNMLQQEAVQLVQELEGDFLAKVQVLPLNQLLEWRILKLPKKTLHVKVQEQPIGESPNSAVVLRIQVGTFDLRRNLLCDLFVSMVGSALFTQLRTVEQLGYYVQTGVGEEENLYCITIIVQGSAKPPLYMLARIYGALDASEAYLQSYTEEDFQKLVRTWILFRTEKPKTLFQESSMHWEEIRLRRYFWDRDECEIAELQALKKEDVVELYRTYLSNYAPKRRALATIVYSRNHREPFETILKNHETDIVAVVPTTLPAYEETPETSQQSPLRGVDLSGATDQGLQAAASLDIDGQNDTDTLGPSPTSPAADAGAVSPLVLSPELRPAVCFQEERTQRAGLNMSEFNSRTVHLDLHYILDSLRFKHTLTAYPCCSWNLKKKSTDAAAPKP